jgi:serine/threonine protein phosphatase PrpC
MDDAHTTLLDIEEAPGTAFFAVYDGHGGESFHTFFHTSVTDRSLQSSLFDIIGTVYLSFFFV